VRVHGGVCFAHDWYPLVVKRRLYLWLFHLLETFDDSLVPLDHDVSSA
jgi:hypothetical protein